MTGIEQIAAAFAGHGKRAALMPYLMAGFPDLDSSRRIGLAAAERAHEHAPPAVVAAALDGPPDLGASPAPALDGAAPLGCLGEAQAPVDRRPAGRLGVHEVKRAPPPLPYPAVGLGPALGGALHQRDQEAPVVV